MVKLVAATQGAGELVGKNAQEVVSYVTRVSAPLNQLNFETAPKLLKYCIEHGHWSPFEHAYVTLEIVTSRAIAAQILRHRSFTFQEFSQRYAKATRFVPVEARRQDTKNRQNSVDDLPETTKKWFKSAMWSIETLSLKMYELALKQGVAKETARFLLPLNTETTIYMTGSIRSWIHYIQLREANGTQLEHKEIALACKDILVEYLPEIAEALAWQKSAAEPSTISKISS
jgi:thymidylate synthase (FAD)